MAFSEILILAVIQGLTEFLPVSSSGHLLAVRLLFGLSDVEGTAFDAFLHLGTLGAVVIFYWRVWWGMIRGVVRNDKEGQDKRELFAKLCVATVPAAVIGYWWQHQAGDPLRVPIVLSISFWLTAVLLWWFGRLARKRIGETKTRAQWRDALYIGLVQVLSLIPGVSRSGMTIGAGMWRGLSKKQATNFSFLMSAPIIAGAGLSSLGSLKTMVGIGVVELLVGFLVSLLFGLIGISMLLKVVEKVALWPFAVYLVVLGGLVLVYGA